MHWEARTSSPCLVQSLLGARTSLPHLVALGPAHHISQKACWELAPARHISCRRLFGSSDLLTLSLVELWPLSVCSANKVSNHFDGFAPASRSPSSSLDWNLGYCRIGWPASPHLCVLASSHLCFLHKRICGRGPAAKPKARREHPFPK